MMGPEGHLRWQSMLLSVSHTYTLTGGWKRWLIVRVYDTWAKWMHRRAVISTICARMSIRASKFEGEKNHRQR